MSGIRSVLMALPSFPDFLFFTEIFSQIDNLIHCRYIADEKVIYQFLAEETVTPVAAVIIDGKQGYGNIETLMQALAAHPLTASAPVALFADAADLGFLTPRLKIPQLHILERPQRSSDWRRAFRDLLLLSSRLPPL